MGRLVKAVQTFTYTGILNQINTSHSSWEEMGWKGLLNSPSIFPLKQTNQVHKWRVGKHLGGGKPQGADRRGNSP